MRCRNDKDILLNSIDATRRHTLIAARNQTGNTIVYHFDVHMKRENEKVFFDL